MESPEIIRLSNPAEMRALARWYRNRAETADNPSVWEGRRRTAKELERMAAAAEDQLLSARVAGKVRRSFAPIDGGETP